MKNNEQKYNEALERAKKIYDSHEGYNGFRGMLEKVFPELKESEDERIRKALIKYYSFDKGGGSHALDNITPKQIVAWLEKQGTQNPADKVEPKFKVGDWVVVDGVTQQVTQIQPEGFDTDRAWNGKLTFKDVHLWTIQDAKDGDVLVEDSCIFIIQKLGDNSTAAKTYCTLYNDGDFDDGSILYFDIDSTKPAAKEQRDLLFQKMIEAGYEWDAEHKQLKKIEQKPAKWSIFDYRTWQYIVSDVLTKHDGIGQYLDDGVCKNIAKYMQENWSKKLSFEQKLAWSGEDDKILKSIIINIENLQFSEDMREKYHHIPNANKSYYQIKIDWLKSLKDRYLGSL